MNNKPQIIVAHPYQQHSYKTALALQKNGYLCSYVTTIYNKPGTITNRFIRFLSGENRLRAMGRREKELDDNKILVINEISMLFLLLLQRIDKRKRYYYSIREKIRKSFNNKLLKQAIKTKVDAVILYDTVSWDVIERLKRNDIKVILDMSAANMAYTDMILKNEIDRKKNGYEDLLRITNTERYQTNLKHSITEIDSADYFFVASEFTKKSLMYSGVSENQIYVCRYGFEHADITPLRQYEKDKLVIIFIGNVDQNKGFAYFEKIIDICGLSNYEFHVYGDYRKDSTFYIKNQNRCSFHGFVTKDEVIKACLESDVLLFPSLSDGFGFSVVESMFCGCIPIVSDNAGVSDIIVQGENGFVVQNERYSEVKAILMELKENRQKTRRISMNACDTARRLTWSKYFDSINESIKEIFLK